MDAQNSSLCAACAKEYQANDAFCNGCGFPIQGSEREQELHLSNRDVRLMDLEEMGTQVESARKSMFYIAGAIGIFTLIQYFTATAPEDMPGVLITNGILIISYIALGLWAKNKPLTALISGLSLYVIIILLNAIFEPMSLLSGIIVKLIIIGYLIKGIKSTLEAERIKKELNIR